MKQTIASLTLAALLTGGTAVFAGTTPQTPGTGANQTTQTTGMMKKHRKTRKHHKPSSSANTTKPGK